jgi:hypothetical protein
MSVLPGIRRPVSPLTATTSPLRRWLLTTALHGEQKPAFGAFLAYIAGKAPIGTVIASDEKQ